MLSPASDAKQGSGTTRCYRGVRAVVPFIEAGEAPIDDLQPLTEWLETG